MTTINKTHNTADAMDWNEAMRLVDRMRAGGRYRDALLVAAGCYLGLRISDLRLLRWSDLSSEEIVVVEKKTGKRRTLRVNENLKAFASSCRMAMGSPADDAYVFTAARSSEPMTRQAVDQMMKQVKVLYHVKSAKVFSAHTLRKTFGRRVWLQECDKGRGDQALVLLCDVFGHSSVAITKRYLGIRQEEILSVYDSID